MTLQVLVVDDEPLARGHQREEPLELVAERGVGGIRQQLGLAAVRRNGLAASTAFLQPPCGLEVGDVLLQRQQQVRMQRRHQLDRMADHRDQAHVGPRFEQARDGDLRPQVLGRGFAAKRARRGVAPQRVVGFAIVDPPRPADVGGPEQRLLAGRHRHVRMSGKIAVERRGAALGRPDDGEVRRRGPACGRGRSRCHLARQLRCRASPVHARRLNRRFSPRH